MDFLKPLELQTPYDKCYQGQMGYLSGLRGGPQFGGSEAYGVGYEQGRQERVRIESISNTSVYQSELLIKTPKLL